MSEFKVKFRGVRGSFPVADKNFLEYGGNTSCVELNIDGRIIILDAGTGIVNVGNDMLEKYISSDIKPENREPMNATILISHIHQDHLLGLTFFKPLHVKSTSVSIFGNGTPERGLSADLSNLIFGKTFPLDIGDIACDMEVTDIRDNQAIVIKRDGKSILYENGMPQIDEDDILITFYKSFVHPQDGVMIYKITYKNKSLVYATDKECYFGGDKKFLKFASGCDLLIHDTQYTTEDYLNPHSPKQGYGHSTYDMAIEILKQTKANNIVCFHYDPSYDDTKLNNIKSYYTSSHKNVIMSYEGLELNII